MKRRTAIILGLAIVVSGCATAFALTSRPAAAPAPAAHRDATEPADHQVVETVVTPTPDDSQQSGNDPGRGVHIESETEHHVIHGSGTISVVSGAVDTGTSVGGADGSEDGDSFSRPRRPARR